EARHGDVAAYVLRGRFAGVLERRRLDVVRVLPGQPLDGLQPPRVESVPYDHWLGDRRGSADPQRLVGRHVGDRDVRGRSRVIDRGAVVEHVGALRVLSLVLVRLVAGGDDVGRLAEGLRPVDQADLAVAVRAVVVRHRDVAGRQDEHRFERLAGLVAVGELALDRGRGRELVVERLEAVPRDRDLRLPVVLGDLAGDTDGIAGRDLGGGLRRVHEEAVG